MMILSLVYSSGHFREGQLRQGHTGRYTANACRYQNRSTTWFCSRSGLSSPYGAGCQVVD